MGQVAGLSLQGPRESLRETLAETFPLVEVKVDDTLVQCLVNTDSQVRICTESLCKEQFENKAVKVGTSHG